MKIDIIDDNELIIYLYNKISNVDFNDQICIENFLKKLFVKLKNYYNLKIEGYYDVNIYIDTNYGIALSLKKDEIEYYYYDNDQVDMRIKISNNKFLYLIDNYNIDKNKYEVYKYLNSIYLLPKGRLESVDIARLMEYSKIIFNGEEILNKGIRILNKINS